MANILKDVMPQSSPPTFVSVKVNCVTNDTFGSIWRRVFDLMRVEVPDAWLRQAPNPDEIRVQLSGLSRPAIVILDEFDRLQDDDGA